jgi:hypothetical protein
MPSRTKTTIKPSNPRWRSLVRLRPRVWLALLLIATVGALGHFVWRQQASAIARLPQYRVTAEQVHITPPPPWIRSDVKTEVLRDAGLSGNLSLLEDWEALVHRLRQAFEFHPWVAEVKQITRRLPNSLEIVLEYRRPVAVVESGGPGGIALLPIDVAAVRLPEADLTDVERQYLPRISNVTGRPIVGEVWDDPRVVGGARLSALLGDVWQALRLVEILPSPHPQVQGEARFYTYEIVTSGRTRVVWGAAPGEERPAGESAFAEKRQRLLDYAAKAGRLDSIDGPEAVDIRKELIVVPRTAKRSDALPR